MWFGSSVKQFGEGKPWFTTCLVLGFSPVTDKAPLVSGVVMFVSDLGRFQAIWSGGVSPRGSVQVVNPLELLKYGGSEGSDRCSCCVYGGDGFMRCTHRHPECVKLRISWIPQTETPQDPAMKLGNPRTG